LGLRLGWRGCEITAYVDGVNIDTAGDFARIVDGAGKLHRVGRALILRFDLPGSLIAIDAAFDFDVLLLPLASAGQFGVGLYKTPILNVLVSGDTLVH
jgi:hypothetical protein